MNPNYDYNMSYGLSMREAAMMRDMMEMMRDMMEIRQWNVDGSEVDYSAEPTTEDKTVVAQAFNSIKEAAEPVKQIESNVVVAHAQKLKSLGFKKLDTRITEIADRSMKQNMISMAGYKRIPSEKLEAAKQMIESRSNYSRKLRLMETSIENYVGQNDNEEKLTIPPVDVLEKLDIAKKSKLFDTFSILHVKAIPDPILLGRVKGVKDSFFIAEWGDDISLEEIMK